MKRETDPTKQTQSEDIVKRDPIPIPKGMTEEEFEKAILDAANRYRGNAPYRALPHPRTPGKDDHYPSLKPKNAFRNSNSLTSSVLRALGIDFKPSEKVPGWNKDVL